MKKIITLFLFIIISLFSIAQQLPSELYYEQEISHKYERYDHGNGYTNLNNPNNDYSNNEMYVQRIESFFEVETGYMDNPYWTDSWLNFSHLIQMFNHLPNFQTFRDYMFSDYFYNFWSNINQDKKNEDERYRFYQELRIGTEAKSVNAPAYHSAIGILLISMLYLFIKRPKRITVKNSAS